VDRRVPAPLAVTAVTAGRRRPAAAVYDRGVGDGLLRMEELRIGHRLVLALAGEVDLGSVAVLHTAVERVRTCGAAEVWIDLTHVEFLDSTGLAALIAARRAVEPERALVVICPEGPAKRTIVVAGLERVFTIHPDRAAAHAG
jgi:anti-anti-sigma factor